MSDHIPFELQEKIIKRLPVKSLIQFRSVSKSWKSVIDNPQFISAHSVHRSRSHRLLVGYVKGHETYVSIPDVAAFPRKNIELTLPLSVKRLKGSKLFGSCHGLFCFSGYYEHHSFGKLKAAVLWNPSIRKSIAIDLPNSEYCIEYVFGFVVCPDTRDPKILLASNFRGPVLYGDVISRELKVFTLSSGAWQSTTVNLPWELTECSGCSQTVVDGFIYWLVSDQISVNWIDRITNLIFAFDLSTNDEFKEVHLPDSLGYDPFKELYINKLRDSLAVIDFCFEVQVCDVWIMEGGSFIKSFTFSNPGPCVNRVLGFKEKGEPILETESDFRLNERREQATLAFYNPTSKDVKCSLIFGHAAD